MINIYWLLIKQMFLTNYTHSTSSLPPPQDVLPTTPQTCVVTIFSTRTLDAWFQSHATSSLDALSTSMPFPLATNTTPAITSSPTPELASIPAITSSSTQLPSTTNTTITSSPTPELTSIPAITNSSTQLPSTTNTTITSSPTPELTSIPAITSSSTQLPSTTKPTFDMTSVFSSFSPEVTNAPVITSSSITFPSESPAITSGSTPEATSALTITNSYILFSSEGTTTIPLLLTTTTSTDQPIYTTATKSSVHEAVHSSTLLSHIQTTTPSVPSVPEVTVSSPNLTATIVSLAAFLAGAIIALVASIALNVFLCHERRLFVKKIKGIY